MGALIETVEDCILESIIESQLSPNNGKGYRFRLDKETFEALAAEKFQKNKIPQNSKTEMVFYLTVDSKRVMVHFEKEALEEQKTVH